MHKKHSLRALNIKITIIIKKNKNYLLKKILVSKVFGEALPHLPTQRSRPCNTVSMELQLSISNFVAKQ
jgi:hypothetical protein